jgi:NitT/TauT family transport system substrate-binding protein
LDFRPDQGVGALGNEVDAVFSWEPYTTEAVSAGNNVIFSSAQLSNLYPDLITFRSSVVKERPEDVRAFLAAWFEAVDFRMQNPEQASQIIADYFEIPVDQLVPDNELHIMTLADNQAIYKQEAIDNLTSIYDVAKINAEFLLRIGALSKMPDMEQLFDASSLP